MSWTTRDVNVLRHISYKLAINDAVEICDQYITVLEAHRDPGGKVTGPDFNASEISCVWYVRERLLGLRDNNDKRFEIRDAAPEREGNK